MSKSASSQIHIISPTILEAATAPVTNWDVQNLNDAWRNFKQRTALVFTGPLNGTTKEEKIAYLLIWVGEKGCDIYNTWQLTSEEENKLETYYKGYATYIKPWTNTVFARYQFHHRIQEGDECLINLGWILNYWQRNASMTSPMKW